jgi:multiple sugar transport system substrate-binding protein
MKRTTCSCLGVLVLLWGVASVYGGGAKESTSAPVTITYATFDYTSDKFNPAVVEAFNKLNPNTHVDVIDIQYADFVQKITTMLASGEPLDCMMIWSLAQYNQMLSRSQVLRLDEYLAKSAIQPKYYGAVFKNLQYEGKTFALPYRADGWVLYYNKGIFDKAGISYPNNSWTWDDFRQIAKTLTVQIPGQETQYGTSFWSQPIIYTCPSLQLAYLKEGWDALHGDSMEYKPGFQLFWDMENVDKSAPTYSQMDALSLSWDTLFNRGKAAMIIAGTWGAYYISQNQKKGLVDFKWGAAQLPTWKGVPDGTAVSPTPMIVLSSSKQKDPAWKFIEFACGKEGAKILAGWGMPPAYKDDEILSVFGSNPDIDPSFQDALAVDRTYPEYPADPKAGAFDQAFRNTMRDIMTGTRSIDQGLAELNKERLDILAH